MSSSNLFCSSNFFPFFLSDTFRKCFIYLYKSTIILTKFLNFKTNIKTENMKNIIMVLWFRQCDTRKEQKCCLLLVFYTDSRDFL